MSVAASIPPIAVVPMTRLATAPDPEAVQSGTQPRMNANDVMMIVRSRRRAPSSAASSNARNQLRHVSYQSGKIHKVYLRRIIHCRGRRAAAKPSSAKTEAAWADYDIVARV
jgi:hypothetical protein